MSPTNRSPACLDTEARRRLSARFYTPQDREDAAQEARLALLEPGARVSDDETGREVAADAMRAVLRRRRTCRLPPNLCSPAPDESPVSCSEEQRFLDLLDTHQLRDRVGAVGYVIMLALSAPALLTEADIAAAVEGAREAGTLRREATEAHAALSALIAEQCVRSERAPDRKQFPELVWRMALLFRAEGSLEPAAHSREELQRCRSWLNTRRRRARLTLRAQFPGLVWARGPSVPVAA